METLCEELAFSLTPSATAHILAIMKKDGLEGQGLRIAVTSGGCSGFEYELGFAPAPERDDVVVDAGALRVFIEKASLEFVAGTVLDYVSGLYGGGLKFSNPKAVHTCGCGTSFSTK
jgi:iron-sulfur cluster assembly accessory protein